MSFTKWPQEARTVTAGPKGVFNDSCIKTVLPALGISMIQPQPSLQAPVSISPHSSMFSIAAPSNHLDDASLNVDFGQQATL